MRHNLKQIANSSYPMSNSSLSIQALAALGQVHFKKLDLSELLILMQATDREQRLNAPSEKFFAQKDYFTFFNKLSNEYDRQVKLNTRLNFRHFKAAR